MARNLNIDEEIFLNQFTQGMHDLQDMDHWFSQYDKENKSDVLANLLNMVIQSHATLDEIRASAESIRKEKSPSAVKLLNPRKPYEKFGWEICRLPEPELLIGFNILLLTLSLSDNRRKSNEEMPCHHWWHGDLSDEKYLTELRLQYRKTK